MTKKPPIESQKNADTQEQNIHDLQQRAKELAGGDIFL